MNCEILDLGLIEYERAWKLQEDYAREIAEGERPPTLLLLEHPHVYTFGRDVTYHGPGQLVGYPLLPLGAQSFPTLPIRSQEMSPRRHGDASDSVRIPQADYVGYVRKLEETLIVALARLGLAAGQRSGLTGVWIQADVHSRCPRCKPEDRKKPAKIAAIGVKVDARGVSRHGFALNVNPDMDYWEGIIACGLENEPIVSLADLFPEPPSMERVKQEVIAAFSEVFHYEVK
jgi:lipoyl(octanoyl) transferase